MHTTLMPPTQTVVDYLITANATDGLPGHRFQTMVVSVQLVTLVLGSTGNVMIIVVMRQPEFKKSMASLYFITLSGEEEIQMEVN